MNIPFTQTKEYLGWHEAVGEKTFYRDFFSATGDLEKTLIANGAFVIINLRIGKVLYCPYGPFFLINPTDLEKKKIIDEIYEIGKKENCVFVRLEDQQNYFKNIKQLVNPPMQTYSKEGIFQPRMEWWLDLRDPRNLLLGQEGALVQSPEEILFSRVHKDHRYSIRRAQKENIKVEILNLHTGPTGVEYFEIFWNLILETSVRDGFGLYDKQYYQAIFNSPVRYGGEMKKFLVLTKHTGPTGVEKYMSVALVVVKDKIANLVFAGSSSEKRELGYNHLMQWEAIREAQKQECEIYNFGGIYENGYGKQTLQGVTSFKKKFGGYAKFHGDFTDIPIQKIKYFLYLLGKLWYNKSK